MASSGASLTSGDGTTQIHLESSQAEALSLVLTRCGIELQRLRCVSPAEQERGELTVSTTADTLTVKAGSSTLTVCAMGIGFALTWSCTKSARAEFELADSMLYGGGHSSCQYFPIDKGSQEVCLEAAFDNGHQGQGTQREPSYVLSNGAFVMIESDLPYLYIGYNQALDQEPQPRCWKKGLEAVGSAELPVEASCGDRLLVVESREDYVECLNTHPLTRFRCATTIHSSLKLIWGAGTNIRDGFETMLKCLLPEQSDGLVCR